MTETLICTDCETSWERTITRGRKPTKCDDCKAGRKPASANTAPVPNGNEKVEAAYKARVQMSGQHVTWLGDPVEYVTKYTQYEGFETSEGRVVKDSIVRRKGFSDKYKVMNIVVRKDGTGWANVMGVGGGYSGGKYAAINIDQITF